MEENPYHVRSSEIAWSCDWWKVRRDEVSVDGKDGEYFYIEQPHAVVIVPITSEGEMVLIR